MSFSDVLAQICAQVEGSVAASVMGMDGIAVETHEVDPAHQPVSIGAALVEYSSIFGQVRSAAAQIEAGDASEFSIRAEKLVAIGRTVTPDYFVVLALSPDGNQGKARYALRIGAPKIAAELA